MVVLEVQVPLVFCPFAEVRMRQPTRRPYGRPSRQGHACRWLGSRLGGWLAMSVDHGIRQWRVSMTTRQS